MAEEEKKTPKAPKAPEIRIPCEVYSRIVGYLRPVNRWNDGKQREFSERVVYKGALDDKAKNSGNRS